MDLTSARNCSLGTKPAQRLGRGPASGSGKFCNRGMKGVGARKGSGVSLTYEGGQMPLFRRLPKRGFNNYEFATRFAPVNLKNLESKFEDGAVITDQDIEQANLVSKLQDGVKILATGDITKKFTLKVTRCSKSAREKIEAAGGSVEESNPQTKRKIRKGRRSKVAAKLEADAKKAKKSKKKKKKS